MYDTVSIAVLVIVQWCTRIPGCIHGLPVIQQSGNNKIDQNENEMGMMDGLKLKWLLTVGLLARVLGLSNQILAPSRPKVEPKAKSRKKGLSLTSSRTSSFRYDLQQHRYVPVCDTSRSQKQRAIVHLSDQDNNHLYLAHLHLSALLWGRGWSITGTFLPGFIIL